MWGLWTFVSELSHGAAHEERIVESKFGILCHTVYVWWFYSSSHCCWYSGLPSSLDKFQTKQDLNCYSRCAKDLLNVISLVYSSEPTTKQRGHKQNKKHLIIVPTNCAKSLEQNTVCLSLTWEGHEKPANQITNQQVLYPKNKQNKLSRLIYRLNERESFGAVSFSGAGSQFAHRTTQEGSLRAEAGGRLERHAELSWGFVEMFVNLLVSKLFGKQLHLENKITIGMF